MFTPLTPRPTYSVLLIVFMLTMSHLGIAQYVKLQPSAEYEASLKTFHAKKLIIEMQEYQATTRKKWWYYLPNVGIQFGLPSVQFGTSTLV